MKYVNVLILILLQLGTVTASISQSRSLVRNIIDQTNVDSLITIVRELSGEKSIQYRDLTTTITDRAFSVRYTREKVVSYLTSRIAATGSLAQEYIVWGTCVSLLVEDPGTDPTLPPIIFCAHLDNAGSGPDSTGVYYVPGADDDASGIAAVLEAMRILKNYKHRRTIVFALWDSEEFGCLGSGDYARTAKAQGRKIEYVLNIDMIGYDANDDGVAHTYPYGTDAGSLAIRDTLFYVNTAYGLGLTLEAPKNRYPGGDALYFHLSGFSATVLIEDFHNDFNPNTHKNTDLSTKFNLPYYLKCAKLAIGSLAQLAEIEGEVTSVAPAVPSAAFGLTQNFPNPFNPSTTISFSIPSRSFVTLKIFDVMGREVAALASEELPSGVHIRTWNASCFPSGTYFYRLQTGAYTETKRLVLLR